MSVEELCLPFLTENGTQSNRRRKGRFGV